MSSFWDSIMVGSTQVEQVVETGSLWAAIMNGGKVEAKPIAKSSKSKAVEQAVLVYETVDSLIVPSDTCIHHWTMDSNTVWVIGTCKLCNGERWFSNNFSDHTKFNSSLTSATPTLRVESKDSLKSDLDVQNLETAYNTQESIDSSEGTE
tara:strand:+ start:3593 stop:4042 length:450 start_codon:yes stop_codon:yes gene_type:complete